MTREEYGDAIRVAVRNHCYRTRAPEGHEEACLDDLRNEPREGDEWWLGEHWTFWLEYFQGKVA